MSKENVLHLAETHLLDGGKRRVFGSSFIYDFVQSPHGPAILHDYLLASTIDTLTYATWVRVSMLAQGEAPGL